MLNGGGVMVGDGGGVMVIIHSTYHSLLSESYL